MDGISFIYKDIKPEATGKLLKYKITKSGYTVTDIQRYLKLSCPQPIYRWFKGSVMPSLNHLYALSRLLGVHMDELIISFKIDYCDFDSVDIRKYNDRIRLYGNYLIKDKAYII